MATNSQYLLISKPGTGDTANIVNYYHDAWDTVDNTLGTVMLGNDYSATTTSTTSNFSASGSNFRRDIVASDTVTIFGRRVLTTVPTGTLAMTLPLSCVWGSNHVIGRCCAIDISAGISVPGAVISNGGTTAIFAGSQTVSWNATAPFTWAIGDIITFDLLYEA